MSGDQKKVFISYSAMRQTQDAQEQSTRAIGGAIGTKVEEIARTAQDYARWNDAVRHPDLDFDLGWADSNVGRYIYETFGYDVTLIIGRDDRTLYTTVDGEHRTADAFQLAPGLDRLVARARLIPRDQSGAHPDLLRDGDGPPDGRASTGADAAAGPGQQFWRRQAAGRQIA